MHPSRAPQVAGLLAAFFTAVALMLALAGPVSAHTELVSWTVEQGPAGDQLRVRYSEPIDGRFLTVSLLDLRSEVVKTQTPGIDPARRTDGLIPLSGVAPGVYTVAWWTRALDGDPSNGSFMLGYRTAIKAAELLPPLGARDPATQPAMFWEDTVWGTLLRWFTYVACALMVGALWFSLAIWRPVWRRAARVGGAPPAALDALDRQASRTYRLMAMAGAGFFLATSLILLVLQVGFVRYSLLQPVTSAAPTPLGPSALSHSAPYKALVEILAGHNGRVWIARMATGVAALLAAVLASPARRWENWRWLLALAAAAGAVFTVSLSSHTGVIPEAPWARFLDWAHLLVMAAWIGGLLPLLLTVRRLRRSGAGAGGLGGTAVALSHRFSAFALGAFAFMASTGFAEAYLNVGRVALLPSTTYGRVLMAKLALFAMLFGFGAVHRLWTLRGLRPENFAGPGHGARRTALEKVLPFEFAAGLSLLVVVALMASLATSKTVWPAHERLGFYSTVTSSGVTVTVRAVPGAAGQNAVALDVVDRRLGPATVGGTAGLQLGEEHLALSPVSAASAGGVQRFTSAALPDLPALDGLYGFSYQRPSYPEVRGVVRMVLPSAIAPANEQ